MTLTQILRFLDPWESKVPPPKLPPQQIRPAIRALFLGGKRGLGGGYLRLT